MNRMLLLSLMIPSIALAETPRPNPENISRRVHEELQRRGINLDEVLRCAQQCHRMGSIETPAEAPGLSDQWPSVPDQQPASVIPKKARLATQIAPIFAALVDTYQRLQVLDHPPRLVIDSSPVIDAYSAHGDEVRVFLALTELIHDSPGEMAWVIAHELGHIVQQRTGRLMFVKENWEFDADVWSLLVTLIAGYDPYSGAGALAKLLMVGDVGLSRRLEDPAEEDKNKSFLTRIEIMYDVLKAVCKSDHSVQASCDEYRGAAHPHFPASPVL